MRVISYGCNHKESKGYVAHIWRIQLEQKVLVGGMEIYITFTKSPGDSKCTLQNYEMMIIKLK